MLPCPTSFKGTEQADVEFEKVREAFRKFVEEQRKESVNYAKLANGLLEDFTKLFDSNKRKYLTHT